MANFRNVTLRWDDPNVIDTSQRVYRSYSPINLESLPEPIATLSNTAIEFQDYVDREIEVYYRVSAVMNDHEEFSTEYTLMPYNGQHLITSSWEGTVSLLDTTLPDPVIWTKKYHSSRVYALERLPDGAVIVGYYDGVLLSISSQGDLLWETNTSAAIEGISTNEDGTIIYILKTTSEVEIRDTMGELLDTITLPIAITGSRRVGLVVKNSMLWYLSNSDLINLDINTNMVNWTVPYTYTSYETSVHVDDDLNAYVEDGGIKKVSPIGDVIWKASSGGFTDFTTDYMGNVYASSRSGIILKLDSNGNEIWNHNAGAQIFNVGVDENGNVYFDMRASGYFHKIDINGENRTPISILDNDVAYAILYK